MKKEIHPKYEKIVATCSCGNTINVYSTICRHLNLELCNKCHPFFTSKKRIINIRGRIELFNKRFNIK